MSRANPTGAKILDFWVPEEPGTQSMWDPQWNIQQVFAAEYSSWGDILAGNWGSNIVQNLLEKDNLLELTSWIAKSSSLIAVDPSC